MGTFQNSRWRPSAILDFRKSDFWPIADLGAADFPSRYQIWCKNVDLRQSYGQKRNSKWWPPPSWIYFRWLFLTYSRLSTVDLNHHTKFGANISIGGWLMVIFQNSRWRPSAILDFRKYEFWPIGSLGMLIFHHGTKFGAKMLIDAQIIAQKRNSADFPLLISTSTQNFWCQHLNRRLTYGNFSKFKMAAVRHLRFSQMRILTNR